MNSFSSSSATTGRQRASRTFSLVPGAALLVLLTGLGLTAFAQAQPQAPSAAPAAMSEQMLDVGGRKLHAIRMGDEKAQATVVFESGFSMDLSAWRRVAPQLAPRAKVLIYSRAGYGQSEPSPAPVSLQQSGRDLSAVLKAAQLPPPYVLVGHSYGAFLIRDFASRHPEQIAGLVFVDPAHERYDQVLKPLDAARLAAEQAHLQQGAPERFRADERYIQSIMDAGKLPDAGGPLPDVPAVVLTSTRRYAKPEVLLHTPAGMAAWRQLHSDFFAQFSNGAHVLTPVSGHHIQFDEPHLVVAAVDQVIRLSQEQAQRRALEAARAKLGGDLQAAAAAADPQAAVDQAIRAPGLSEADVNNAGYAILGDGKQAPRAQLAALVLGANARLYPKSDNAADSHGEVLLKLGRRAEARAEFARALSLAEAAGRSPRVLDSYRKHLAEAAELAAKP
ncbi:alpha/beta hydrolase [Paucibacter sp. DJ1R-11]|uniref:alpha/beta fold hydrolase n=1 Tax=Paucibacter sp. DJ1R-11 TaxID=2893556 RepID=UPI0021E42277|nr:alpha/beta hydrolase [Paucibacter sp. DJ1R-11]MCV2363908.1 alpha/beta hydrolase [Paucibacter sp. DJ1R-11]